MANDCTNNDDDVSVPDTVVDPPGNGNPDGGPVVEDIMDINANYCVNAEDPFQNGERTTPLEIWELPEAGVTKEFTYTPADTNSGKALYKTNPKYTQRTYLDYESSGTIKYTPYGNHALTADQYTSIVGDTVYSTFDGITYEVDYSDLLDAPEVDAFRMVIYDADKVSAGVSVSDEYTGLAHVATFWDLATFTVMHAIKLDIVSRDVVLRRSPSYPSSYNTQTDGLAYDRTNLQAPNQSGVYISRFPADDSTRCYWGRKDGQRLTSTRGPGSSLGASFFRESITPLNWKNQNRIDMTYNVLGRTLAYRGAVTDEDTGEYLVPQGVPSAVKPRRSLISHPGQHIITLDLPADVTSVTTLEWQLTPWEPFVINKWLHDNRGMPARNTSATGMTHVHQNDNAPSPGTRITDRADWTVGAGRLGAGIALGFSNYRIFTNNTGLKMGVEYLNHAHYYKLPNQFAGTLKSVMEFRRADKNSPWEPYGSFTAKDVFDSRWPNWENTITNKFDGDVKWDAYHQLHPFYDDNDGDLWCISYGRVGRNALYPRTYSECFKPDLVASSHARSIGTANLQSYELTDNSVPQVGGRFLDARDVTNVIIYNVDRDDSALPYKEFSVDYTTGTVARSALVASTLALPPRLAHLNSLEWYALQKWPVDQQSVVYNGFTISSLPDTPAVPNMALGSYSFWINGTRRGNSPPGTYRTNTSRRIMMRVGEISAQDANGNEVWRAEPPDARDWVEFNTRTRTLGRDMMFNAYPEQTNISPNELGFPYGISAEEVRRTDPEFADLHGSDGTPATFYPSAGLDMVRFGESMFMVGTKLYVSHASLPTGDDLPPVGDWNKRKRYVSGNTTPRDATSPHEFGYIIIDLATIPELNP